MAGKREAIDYEEWRRLSRDFFRRDTHTVARALLGKIIVRRWGGENLAGRIVEVESYVGEDDAACHASRGRTPRTAVMFGEAGHAYIYLIYGMYYCLNVVTERIGFPAAVLVRALEPLAGIAAMQRRRNIREVRQLGSGPGKLTQALRIDRTLNGEDVARSDRLFVADDGYRVRARDVVTATRIGVAYAGQDALLPWRYYIKGNPYVSKHSP